MHIEKLVSEQLKAIYDRLQDEESRVLFKNRLLCFLDRDTAYLHDNLVAARADYLQSLAAIKKAPIKTEMDLRSLPPQPVVLYGAGENLDFSQSFVAYLGFPASCVCDSDPRKHGKTVCGLTVISPEELIAKHRDSIIVISTTRFGVEVRKFLLDNGFSDERIYSMGTYEPQYFGLPFLTPVDDEIYVDVGCLDGETIDDFIRWCGGNYKKVYGLEADPLSAQRTFHAVRTAGWDHVEILPKAAWSQSATLSFNSDGTKCAAVSQNGTIKVEATSIDELVGSGAVTLIKMDIEGAELEALKGSAETIKRCKPRLVVCVYHKPEDILEIPLYVLSLEPSYRFYIRQHSLTVSETVLYAIPEALLP